MGEIVKWQVSKVVDVGNAGHADIKCSKADTWSTGTVIEGKDEFVDRGALDFVVGVGEAECNGMGLCVDVASFFEFWDFEWEFVFGGEGEDGDDVIVDFDVDGVWGWDFVFFSFGQRIGVESEVGVFP